MLAYAAGRGAYGVALIGAPDKVAAKWIGAAAERSATQVAVRGIGARDLALAGGTVAAALGNGPPLPWLAASVACDLSDIAVTLAADSSELPERSRPGTIALAGFSALAGAALAVAAKR